MEEVVRYPRRLFGDGCYLQGLVQGNMILSEAEVRLKMILGILSLVRYIRIVALCLVLCQNLYNLVKSKLDLSPPPPLEAADADGSRGMIPEGRSFRWPQGQSVVRVRSFNPADENTVVVNVYQLGPDRLAEGHTLIGLLESIMEEPLNDVLRTKEQLGYLIYASMSNANGHIGLSVVVGAQVTR